MISDNVILLSVGSWALIKDDYGEGKNAKTLIT